MLLYQFYPVLMQPAFNASYVLEFEAQNKFLILNFIFKLFKSFISKEIVKGKVYKKCGL